MEMAYGSSNLYPQYSLCLPGLLYPRQPMDCRHMYLDRTVRLRIWLHHLYDVPTLLRPWRSADCTLRLLHWFYGTQHDAPWPLCGSLAGVTRLHQLLHLGMPALPHHLHRYTLGQGSTRFWTKRIISG